MRLLLGDCLEQMKTLDSQSVDCCVTSPPYYGLRDYGVSGQLGLEETPEEFVNNLVKVFQEVRRVLKDDGTLWLNLGDSYVGGGRGGNSDAITGEGKNKSQVSKLRKSFRRDKAECAPNNKQKIIDLKTKDLMGIPWRVAFALQTDGWYLRQDIIWNKPNAMPESVTDRCTKAHEYIFLLSKSKKYYFDSKSIKEPAVYSGKFTEPTRGMGYGVARGANGRSPDRDGGFKPNDGLRNKRSVWTVNTKPFRCAHFATFPQELVEPCILAGSPVGGIILDPFFGAGTTGVVAKKLGRDWVGCELNEEYLEIAKRRIEAV